MQVSALRTLITPPAFRESVRQELKGRAHDITSITHFLQGFFFPHQFFTGVSFCHLLFPTVKGKLLGKVNIEKKLTSRFSNVTREFSAGIIPTIFLSFTSRPAPSPHIPSSSQVSEVLRGTGDKECFDYKRSCQGKKPCISSCCEA